METQFQGLAWVSYDEQLRRREVNDLSLSWDQVDLELWIVLFYGLAKPHCLTCCSPYHKQSSCPSADYSRRQPKGPVCFMFKTKEARLILRSGIYIYILTNILEGTVFLFQGLTYNEEVKLRRYNLK